MIDIGRREWLAYSGAGLLGATSVAWPIIPFFTVNTRKLTQVRQARRF